MSSTPRPAAAMNDNLVAQTIAEFGRTLEKLGNTRPFAKGIHQERLFTLASKLLLSDAGIEAMYQLAPQFDAAGLFSGGDWEDPRQLEASLARGSLTGSGMYPALECLSQLRLLAVACGDASSETMSPEEARAYLEDVVARNLDLPFPEATEVTRLHGPQQERMQRHMTFVLDRLGTSGIIGALAAECERVLLQRPIMVGRVAGMLQSAARVIPAEPESDAAADYDYARRLINALEGPTLLSRQCPGADEYRQALGQLDESALKDEASIFGSRMDETGLVSRSHATLLHHVADVHPHLLAEALALDNVGRTSLDEYLPLIIEIIHRALLPETARGIYGLSRLLNRGILFFQPVAPGLRHIMVAQIEPTVAAQLQAASPIENPPDANALLLAGTLNVLGQPRGVDQGHNPTCQAARAISLWSHNDVGYLLELIAAAAIENDVVMHFEGDAVRSSELTFGLAEELHTELDPVSLVLTPHLDKIYMEMSRRTIGRGEDGHRWVNPEFHGWWVYRDFASLIDVQTEAVGDIEQFIRCFYAAYHPEYNGDRDLVYAQPCGVVSTDTNAEFVGWHAVSIERIARDPAGDWRVYFFNPNRDKQQNWGQGIVTSISDNGESEGEASLPFEQFLMRLYVFHYKSIELGDVAAVPDDAIERICEAVSEGWAAGKRWRDDGDAC